MKKPKQSLYPYRLPAEWEPQESTWLTWPQNKKTWGAILPYAENTYLDLSHIILEKQDLYIVVNPGKIPDKLDELSQEDHNYTLHLIQKPTDDCWIRDYGGITVYDNQGERRLIDWEFNSWGGKYPPWENDNNIPKIMEQTLLLEREPVPMILEGGSIDVNGSGILLTTESCLLNPNRNHTLCKEQIEYYLKRKLGVETILWLSGKIKGDDTDGHVDQLARFISPKKIVCTVSDDPSRTHYQSLLENYQSLTYQAEMIGLEVLKLPLPSPMVINNLHIPASYANFILINEGIIVPTFGEPNDNHVLNFFAEQFPEREIFPLDARFINYGQGGLHCISMQIPRILKNP